MLFSSLDHHVTILSRVYATLGTGMPSVGGNVTECKSNNENNNPRKCESIVFADACKYNKREGES